MEMGRGEFSPGSRSCAGANTRHRGDEPLRITLINIAADAAHLIHDGGLPNVKVHLDKDCYF
jgi:hypothetical protein